MTPLEAVQQHMDAVREHIQTCPEEVRALIIFAVAEIDRQLATHRNPTLAAMREAVPTSLVRDLVNDQRRGVASPSSLAAKPDAPMPEQKKGSGWVETSFPDRTNQFELIDRMVASQIGGPNDTRRLR
jgi:hypothetical protein